MQQLFKFFARFRFKSKSKKKIIILGTEYPEFKLYKLLQSKGNTVLFFISDDPWKYNSRIEDAFCRYPDELFSLCDKYKIDCVYYCEHSWLGKVSAIPPTCSLLQYEFNVHD